MAENHEVAESTKGEICKVEQKEINTQSYQISYRNHFVVKELRGDSIPPKIEINNFLCKQEGDALVKVTELVDGNRKITLADDFVVKERTEARHDDEKREF